VFRRVRAHLAGTRSDGVVALGPVSSDTNFPRVRPESALWPLLATPLVVTDAPRPLLPQIGVAEREWENAFRVSMAPALPRVFWAGAWEAHADPDVAAPMLRAASGAVAIVSPEGAAALAAGGVPREAGGMPAGPVSAERVAVEGGRVTATLVAPRDGLAVILDPWFPGWSATVDGAPARLVRANFAFMAVPLSQGRHELALTYRNTQVARGFLLSAVTLAALVAVLVWRRQRAKAHFRR
jgi:hypothetical protein